MQAYDINYCVPFCNNTKDKKSGSKNYGIWIEVIDTMGKKITYYAFIDGDQGFNLLVSSGSNTNNVWRRTITNSHMSTLAKYVTKDYPWYSVHL